MPVECLQHVNIRTAYVDSGSCRHLDVSVLNEVEYARDQEGKSAPVDLELNF
jgi:hypothetical protein